MSSNEAGSSCLPRESIHPTCTISFTSCFKIGRKSNLPAVLTGMDLRQGIGCLHLLQYHLLSELVQIMLSRSPTNTHYRIRRDLYILRMCEETGMFGASLRNMPANRGTAALGATGKSREGQSKIQSLNPGHLSAWKGHISMLVWPRLGIATAGIRKSSVSGNQAAFLCSGNSTS